MKIPEGKKKRNKREKAYKAKSQKRYHFYLLKESEKDLIDLVEENRPTQSFIRKLLKDELNRKK